MLLIYNRMKHIFSVRHFHLFIQIHVTSDDFYKNTLSIWINGVTKNIKDLREPVDKNKWVIIKEPYHLRTVKSIKENLKVILHIDCNVPTWYYKEIIFTGIVSTSSVIAYVKETKSHVLIIEKYMLVIHDIVQKLELQSSFCRLCGDNR